MLHLQRIWPLCFLALLSACMQGQIFAQDKSKPTARLFKAFVPVFTEDVIGLVDVFAIELREERAVGYIVCYGLPGELPGSADFVLNVHRNFLVGHRGVDPDQIKTVNGGRYKDRQEAFVELWIVPAEAEPPVPKRYEAETSVINGKFIEFDDWDVNANGEDVGSVFDLVKFAACADVLKAQADSVLFLVTQTPKDSAPGLWRRVAKSESVNIQSLGIEPTRIKIIFAGTLKEDGDSAHVQVWILPKTAPPPVKEAKSEKTPREARQLAEFDDYRLTDAKFERGALEGIADVMKADPHLMVYIISQTKIADGEPESPIELPAIDPVKLSNSWRTELSEKLGVDISRIVVIHNPPDAENLAGIKVWVASLGVPLPSEKTDSESDPD